MKLRYPEYYEKFSCIAGACEDTCCAGWEIDIDDECFEKYMQIPGEFGERIRSNIKEYESEEEDVYESHGFVLKKDKRCPFLNEDNLCDIIIELGEEAICDVCTNTPRNFFEYDNTREISISPSCAEAGRLIFGHREKVNFVEKMIEEEFSFVESDEELSMAKNVRCARDVAIRIFQSRELSIEERLVWFLFYAREVQERMNEEAYDEIVNIEEVAIRKEALAYCDKFAKVSLTETEKNEKALHYYKMRMESFAGMESINEEWKETFLKVKNFFQSDVYTTSVEKKEYRVEKNDFLTDLQKQQRTFEYEQLLVYHAFLMLIRCLDDNNFWGKAQFIVTSFLVTQDFDFVRYLQNGKVFTVEDRVDIARILAKEVEHSEVNMEYLEDEFLFEELYHIDSLCEQILFVG